MPHEMLPDLTSRQHTSPLRPLLEGDFVARQQVAGFAWKAAPDAVRSTHLDDRLLFTGEEDLIVPPERPMPQAFEPIAPMPPADLPAGRVHVADDIDMTLRFRASALLDKPASLWQPVIRPLVGAIHANGHRVWLSGGIVRDLVSGVALHDVNDLDLAGTVPTGRFSDILYQTMRACGMAGFPMTVHPGSLVCAVQLYYSTTRMLEYRGLSKGGFCFAAVGSTLEEDARHRDFTFNTLLYDPLEHEILDPTGRGLADLTGEARCFWPMRRPSDPDAAAEIIIRALKFAMRWHGSKLDLQPFCDWVATLPKDMCRQFDETRWEKARKVYLKDSGAGTLLDERSAFAELLAQPGRELLESLIGGGR